MALLHACAFLHRRDEVSARAVTVDHGLQSASAEVAERVRTTAESWGVPAETIAVQVSAGVEGLEAAAREARYGVLENVRQRVGAEWIITAHTRNDQAETVLLGLLRGSGTRSLAGMAPRTARLLRPLLGLDRSDTEASCRAQGIEVWDDPMNTDPAFARVRARGLVERFERELGQPLAANLARTADLCRADADCLDEVAWTVAAELAERREIDLMPLRDLPEAILSRALRSWLLSLGVPAQGFGADRIATLCRLVRSRTRGRLSLPGDTEALVDRDRLSFRDVERAGRSQRTPPRSRPPEATSTPPL